MKRLFTIFLICCLIFSCFRVFRVDGAPDAMKKAVTNVINQAKGRKRVLKNGTVEFKPTNFTNTDL